ncbi:MAG: ABC transporter substrate-binding protein [Thermomicrobiales bacterium]
MLYTIRNASELQGLIGEFGQRVGAKFMVKTMTAPEITDLVHSDSASPQGDVILTSDVVGLETLRRGNLLDRFDSPLLAAVPAAFRAADGSWTGVVARSRNLIYNPNLIQESDLPRSLLALRDPGYRGQLGIGSLAEGGVRLWLAWLMLERGLDASLTFVKDLLANGARLYQLHTEIAAAVANGELALGLVNHTHYADQLARTLSAPLRIAYLDQGAGDMGTLVMPISAAIIRNARHPVAARALLQMMLEHAGQLHLFSMQREFPLAEQSSPELLRLLPPGVKPLDQVRYPRLDIAKIAEIEAKATEVFSP